MSVMQFTSIALPQTIVSPLNVTAGAIIKQRSNLELDIKIKILYNYYVSFYVYINYINCITLLILEMLKSMDLDYYHFRAYSIPMLDSRSWCISTIETSSENNDACMNINVSVSILVFQEFFFKFQTIYKISS